MNLEQGRCMNYATTDDDNIIKNSTTNYTNKQDEYYYYYSTDEDHLLITSKGQWTPEEDFKLVNSISIHGPGHWTYLARSAGLKRSGKSCRLRWLNYLRPDVKRGNLTLQEQILILQLHSQFGNRWSKIAQHLPGRTDNEIKNYWRTRVAKLAKQHFNCHASTLQFREAILHVLLPILTNQLQQQQQQQQQQALVLHPEETVSHEKLSISTVDSDDQRLHNYCSVNSNTVDSPSNDVVPPMTGSSWITTTTTSSYPNSYNQSGIMLRNYPRAQSVPQISDLLLPSMSPSLINGNKQADYHPSTNILKNIPSSTSNTTTTTISSTIGSWPVEIIQDLPCLDDDDSQYYDYCSSWWLGGDGGVGSDNHCYFDMIHSTT